MQRVVSTEFILSAELVRSETLIWAGRPRQGVFFESADARRSPLPPSFERLRRESREIGRGLLSWAAPSGDRQTIGT